MPLTQVTHSGIQDGTITDADINASAAISGSKVSPNFGSQNTTTTGTTTAASFIPTSSSIPTNGVYLPAANSVAISTNGNGRLFIASDGKVGIGTSSLESILTVEASGTQQALFSARANAGAGGGMTLQTDASDDGLFRLYDSTGAIKVQLDTDGGDNYIALGNVGIGTTSPASLLHIYENSTNGASITLENTDGTAYLTANNDFLYLDADSQIFRTQTGSERARINSSGRLLVGTSTARNVAWGGSSLIQAETTSSFALSVVQNSNNANGCTISLGKSRGAAVGGTTILNTNDDIGIIAFAGADGTDVETQAASIACEVDGTPGANDMPGRLVFSTTADGASSPTERMRIDNTGKISASAASTYTFEASTTGTTHHYNALLSGSQVFVVYFNGDVRIAAGKTYGNLSDASVKENIVDATPKLSDICRLQVRNFSVKDEENSPKYIGFIAQEFETVFPALVQEDDKGLKGIKESALIPILVKALQEATERIETLETEVLALKAS